MILDKEEKIKFLKNNFHEYFDITLSSNITEENINGHVNVVIPLSKLDEFYNLTELRKLFNENLNNIIFTPADNDEIIYSYESYNEIFFIRMTTFSYRIRMHIIPKEINASNSILIFKESSQTIDENNFQCSDEYIRYEDKALINLYYQELGQMDSNGIYKFDIKEKAKNLDKIQLNFGYSYNDTNPTDEINHYTGILDESNELGEPIEEFTEFNASLIDANYDNISDFTNVIKALDLMHGEISWPTETDPYPDNETGFDNPHEIEKIYHKTIKYFNDDIYIEENNKFITADWDESLINVVRV